MTLRFLRDRSEPAPWVRNTSSVRDFQIVQNLMRITRYRNDFADDWTPDMNRDCQGKVAAALAELYSRGVPLHAMRGYAGSAAIKKRALFVSHAILIIRVQTPATTLDVVLDNCQAGVRSLAWAERADIYRNMKPAMRAALAP